MSLSKNLFGNCWLSQELILNQFLWRIDYYHNLVLFPPGQLPVSWPSQLPEVVADTDERPCHPCSLDTPIQKPPESEDFLYLPKYMLNQAGSVRHPTLPLRTRQLLGHPFSQ